MTEIEQKDDNGTEDRKENKDRPIDDIYPVMVFF